MTRFRCILAGAVLGAVSARPAPSTASVAAAPALTPAPAVVVCATGHVRFTLPAYWTVVPDTVLARYNASARALDRGRAASQYVLAIQRKALLDFTMPYALVELLERSMPKPTEVAAKADSFAEGVVTTFLPLHRKGLFGEVKPGIAVYDTNLQVIVGYWTMVRTEDKARIAAMMAVFPYAHGYIRFQFFMHAEDQERDMAAAEEIINSVSFDPGFAYPRPGQAAHTADKLGNFGYLLVGVLVAWLVVRILVRRTLPTIPVRKPPWLRHRK